MYAGILRYHVVLYGHTMLVTTEWPKATWLFGFFTALPGARCEWLRADTGTYVRGHIIGAFNNPDSEVLVLVSPAKLMSTGQYLEAAFIGVFLKSLRSYNDFI